jgi:hypothetical protein
VITLYRSRGDQLEQYGYAAFGLSVIQYAIMSFVNLLGNLICPDYPTLYIVRSEVMEEAEARGGRFIGTIGKLVSEAQGEQKAGTDTVQFKMDLNDSEAALFGYEDTEAFSYHGDGETTITVPSLGPCVVQESYSERLSTVLAWSLFVVIVLAPYVIIAGLTKFNPQKSTSIQRGFMMSWLVIGQIGGFLCGAVMFDDKTWRQRLRTFIISLVLFGAPSIGGFVMVGIMMKQSQYCVDI